MRRARSRVKFTLKSDRLRYTSATSSSGAQRSRKRATSRLTGTISVGSVCRSSIRITKSRLSADAGVLLSTSTTGGGPADFGADGATGGASIETSLKSAMSCLLPLSVMMKSAAVRSGMGLSFESVTTTSTETWSTRT